MILLIDAGNTRLKWAWLTDEGMSAQLAAVHRGAPTSAWAGSVFDARRKAARVLASNVAGAAMAETLARLARQAYGVEVEFMTAAPEYRGVINGYLDPGQLGVDRWLAVIGAWIRVRGAVCVIDAGTAVKVDSVDAAGRHLGGFIVPGVRMMRESLMGGTSDIAAAAARGAQVPGGVLADNTMAAVSRGALLALAGLVDRTLDMAERAAGVAPRLIVTGGDAGAIAEVMRVPCEIVPNLVLEGLAQLAARPDRA